MVVPPDNLVVVLMEWPLKVGRSGENQLLRRIDVLEIVLRTEPMKLVGVGICSGARVKRYLDFLESFFRALDSSVEFPGVSHHEIHDERALPLLGEDVVEVDVLLEVRIPHSQAPEFFLGGGKLRGPVTGFMDRAEDVEQIREGVQDATGIEVAESEHAAIRAARVVRKDRFQRRMSLRGGAPLLAGVPRDADHPDLAI